MTVDERKIILDEMDINLILSAKRFSSVLQDAGERFHHKMETETKACVLFLEYLKVEWVVERSAFRPLICRTSSQFGFRRQTACLLLRLCLKCSFLTKLLSGDTESSLTYTAIVLSFYIATTKLLSMMHVSSFLTFSFFIFFFNPALHGF